MTPTVEYGRQRDIFDPASFPWPVHIIGLGGIGSAVAPTLAKLGIAHLILWDDDALEVGNIPSQFCYRLGDVGARKVTAAAEILRTLMPTTVETCERRFPSDGSESPEGIVVSGVDSMTNRSAIWSALRFSVHVPLYLDGRLGGEILELHTVRPATIGDVEQYEATLFSDAEATPLPCAARAVIHPALVLAGLVAAQLTRWLRGETYYRKIAMDLKTMTMLTANPVRATLGADQDRRG